MFDLHISEYNGTAFINSQNVGNIEYIDNQEGCPSLAFVLGKFDIRAHLFANINSSRTLA